MPLQQPGKYNETDEVGDQKPTKYSRKMPGFYDKFVPVFNRLQDTFCKPSCFNPGKDLDSETSYSTLAGEAPDEALARRTACNVPSTAEVYTPATPVEKWPPHVKNRQLCFSIDESPFAAKCVEWAVEKRLIFSTDEIHLLTVVVDAPPSRSHHHYSRVPVGMFTGGMYTPRAPVSDASNAKEIINRRKEEAYKLLGNHRDIIRLHLADVEGSEVDENIPKIELHVIVNSSSPERGILQFVKEHGCNLDLLLMGSRGMGTTKRSSLLSMIGIGSVSDFVLRHVDIPVLILRPAKDENKMPSCVKSKEFATLIDKVIADYVRCTYPSIPYP
mmetsp:Transcript_36258/g.43771  ORF Transcript_36258/g.43771 Transcript_36258/m.43771 type:complete len:330 (+) Transcript_36258:149-1138(+)|eukprot:CAMPEP_0197846210 /NCGR_PEP_ID=MMETSP1438-20131217/2995_1 /TAXON_ID=1461541 /ORGANISM="Pterosperma sp., Strain CCMP1384" /LENGTH=329 /DNA_ID=CAMNT_0043457775 /DNA_START=149 /DNA_END=1138 /DNA_ORIENTATION=+